VINLAEKVMGIRITIWGRKYNDKRAEDIVKLVNEIMKCCTPVHSSPQKASYVIQPESAYKYG